MYKEGGFSHLDMQEQLLKIQEEAKAQLAAITDKAGLDALKLKLYIDAHYAEDLSTDKLAEVLHMGKTNLYAVCQKRFRLTPMQMVTRARMEAAKELLLATRESIKFIAQTVGFSDQSYFSKVFRKETGCTPMEYRAASREELPQRIS